MQVVRSSSYNFYRGVEIISVLVVEALVTTALVNTVSFAKLSNEEQSIEV